MTFPDTGFVRIKQIIGDKRAGIPGVLPMAASTWWEGVRSGRFPPAVKLGPKMTAWKAEDIRKLMDALANAPKAA